MKKNQTDEFAWTLPANISITQKSLNQRLLYMLIAGFIVGLSFGIVIGAKIVQHTVIRTLNQYNK